MTETLKTLLLPFQYFVEIQQRIYWNNLAIAFFVALLIYLFSYNAKQKKSAVGLFRFIFPWRIYFHRSAINDYLFFFTSILLTTTFIVPIFTLVSINVALTFKQILSNFSFLSMLENSLKSSSIFLALTITLLIAIINDFCIFLIHTLQHRIPWLWEFHKVHHSAEVMTPITVYRMHPVDNFLIFSFSSLVLGCATGFLQFIFQSEASIYNIAGVNLVFIIFYMFTYNLRHSHIWLSYGPYLSKILISPAQHQIHHSMDRNHFDKNMGFIFSFWDGLFGTLYIPKQKETLKFGINQKENIKFSSFWSLYIMPFINLAKDFNSSNIFKLKNLASLIVFFSITGSALYFSKEIETPISKKLLNTLFMEDMTWQEIQQALDNNKTTVLVPTGGTEQNGPHLILGKHNYIIKYTSEKIARALENTLIAPTINYVPEGNINPPDGHMRFSGTLSINEKTFADILEATARSLKIHGFKVIAFIGESGGNQSMQNAITAKLNLEWQAEGIRVIQVDDYYFANGQIRYLMNEGYNQQQIGGHAGIRDTSELMAIYPAGVRRLLLTDNSAADFIQTGADGNAKKANGSLGKVLLEMKITAAINQIKKQLKPQDG